MLYSWGNFPEWVIVMGITAAGALVPVILAVLLTVWLVNKKRRDDQMIQRLIEIRQALEEIRDRLALRSGRKE